MPAVLACPAGPSGVDFGVDDAEPHGVHQDAFPADFPAKPMVSASTAAFEAA